jgi:hypothetical protein
MKLSYLLINVVLVAGGIFAYDQLRSPEQARSQAPAYDPLRADDYDADAIERDDPEPMRATGMQGSHDKATVRALEDRIASLERKLARLPRGGGSTDDGTPLPVGGKLPELSTHDFIDPDNPTFDEKTVQTLEAYVDEINRRKQEQRQRDRIGGEMERLGIELTEEQKKGVIDQTLLYQTKARELLRQAWPRDEKGREDRKQAFQGLQEEYKTTINRLVPADAAEKISTSRVARGIGFYGGGNARGPRRGGGGRGDR